jgi:hypothetical protein
MESNHNRDIVHQAFPRQSLLYYLYFASISFFFVNAFAMALVVFYGLGSFSYIKLFVGMSALCGLFLIMFQSRRFIIKKDELTIFTFVLLIVLVTALQVLYFPNLSDESGRESHTYLIGTTVYNICYLIFGYVFVTRGAVQRSNKISLFLFFLVISLVVNNLGNGLVIDYNELPSNSQNEISSNHLLAGPYFYIVIILAYSFAHDRVRKLAFMASLALFFMLGGRADLIIFVLSVISFSFLKDFSTKKIIFTTLLVSLIVLIIFSSSGFILDSPAMQRMVFNQGISSDRSLIQRIDQLYAGISGLKQQFLFGNINFLVQSSGSFGAYIHNGLSVWQFYGFFVFMFVFYLLVAGFFRVKSIVNSSDDAVGTFVVLLFLSSIFGLLLAKSVTYVILWVSIGCLWGRYYSYIK